MSIFDIERFNRVIEEKKVEILHEQQEQNYILMVIQNKLSISDINFNAFEPHHVVDVLERLEEAITDENEDGEISLDPFHPYTRMLMLTNKISRLEGVPKVRPTSPYIFL